MDNPLVGAILFPVRIILTVRLNLDLLTNSPGLARASATPTKVWAEQA